MADKILVFYGSYRADRMGIRMADYRRRGAAARAAPTAELIDAKAVGLPMLDRMYKEYPAGHRAAGDGGTGRRKSARRTPSCSSSANTTGACSRA